MKTRYGIHTIQMTMLLSRKWYDKMFETLSQKKGDGVFYKDTKYQSDAGIEKHICTYFCDRGVVLYLFVQKKHKNAYGGGQRPRLRSSAAAVRPNGHPNIDS